MERQLLCEALRIACEHVDSEQKRMAFTELLAKLSPLPTQVIDGFSYDYNDNTWMI